MPKRRRPAEEQFHVEVITKARVNDEGDWEYFVKWGGYSSEDNSWEPTENVRGCKRLLKSFWEHVGTDNEDYFPGHVVTASQDWIENEKEFFAEAFGRHVPKRKKKESSVESSDSKRQVGRVVKQKTKRVKPSWEYVPVLDSDDGEYDGTEPLSMAKKQKHKHKAASASAYSEDSDVPLSTAHLTSSTIRDLGPWKHKGKGVDTLQPQASTPSIIRTEPSKQPGDIAPSSDPLFSAPSSPIVPTNRRALPDALPVAIQDARSKAAALPKLTIPANTPSGPKSTTTPQLPSAGQKSATTPQLPFAGPSKPLPSHRERQMNPRVQMMPMQVVDKSGAASISTKQKIAERAGAQKAPPVVHSAAASSGAESIFPQKSKSLASLSFKKKTVKTSTAIPGDRDMVQSPVSIVSGRDNPSRWSPSLPVTARSSKTSVPPIPRPAPPSARAQQVQSPGLAEAEQFLNSFMPEELAAPMYEPTGDETDQDIPVIPPSISRKAHAINIVAPRKWQWSGELYMELGPDKADRLCNITLSEPTDPRPLGLRFSVLYTTDVSMLRLKKFHDMPDLYLLLRACGPIQQCCKVSQSSESDLTAVSTIGAWMARKRQFTYAHVYLDGDPAGLLVVFPSAITEFCTLFKVPAYLKDQSSVLAALLPWTLTVKQFEENRTAHAVPNGIVPLGGPLDPKLLDALRKSGKLRTMLQQPLFAQGLRIHKFNAEIYDFLTRAPRNYCIWHSPADGTATDPGYETLALEAVLDECEADNVGHKSDVRVVFVHVGALPTFHNLQALATRRRKQVDMRIYSYGTHPTVPPDRWGLREIYPIGGILTVTPTALMEDPFGVYKILKLIEQHPFWMCYVHPYVLAALIRYEYPDSDLSSLAKPGNFYYGDLLTLIEDGTLSLLTAPPLIRAPRASHKQLEKMIDPRQSWSEWLINMQFSEPQEMLMQCVDMLQEAFPKVSDRDLMITVEKEVLADMCQMQLQPDIIDNYRRYVVLTEARSAQLMGSEGCELVTASDFDFRDDYFSTR